LFLGFYLSWKLFSQLKIESFLNYSVSTTFLFHSFFCSYFHLWKFFLLLGQTASFKETTVSTL
jgi:hypothetical protein